jgi:hypothetical protein
MNYDWCFTCVQTCIKLNLEPCPPDLIIQSCRHSKYKVIAQQNKYQLPLPVSIYCINVAQSADRQHTHTHERTVIDRDTCQLKIMTLYVSDILELVFLPKSLFRVSQGLQGILAKLCTKMLKANKQSHYYPLKTVCPIYRTDVPLPFRCYILYIFFLQL